MGDADSEIIVPVQEIETWMDEALEIVDEGLDHLFLYMINVNDRTKQILRKLKCLESFKQWFFALNLLIVPVVISILICFSTRNTIDSSGLEAELQLVVAFFMFLSGSIGIPLYFYSMWESYRCAEQLNGELGCIRECVPRTETGELDRTSLSEDSFLTFLSNEASLERLNDFSRLLAERMPGNMRLNIERRLSDQLPDIIEGDGGNVVELSVVKDLSSESNPNEFTNNKIEEPIAIKENTQESTVNTEENVSISTPNEFETCKLAYEPDLKSSEPFSTEPLEVMAQSEEKNRFDTWVNDFDLQRELFGPNSLSEFEKQLDGVRLFCHYRGDAIDSEDYY